VPPDWPGDTSVPIGRPIANTEVYVLDADLQPVPIGVPGELCVGGDGLARGYLNQPELTAEKFVPHPFSRDPSARLYRTGDRVRYLPDGNLQFLGRFDRQVKIRGYRIEPGEVEAALARHPSVRECAVVAEVAASGDRQLVACVVSHPDPKAVSGDLRRFLAEQLPPHMLPAAFRFLDALPLTPHGKVDRGALVTGESAHPAPAPPSAPPRTPVEESLAAIWRQLLGRDQVGVHDNFFALGGQSVLAIQVLSRVREAFQIDLPVGALLEAPTVASLSLVVTQRLAEAGTAEELAEMLTALEALPMQDALSRLGQPDS
jgi:hypothetical protein